MIAAAGAVGIQALTAALGLAVSIWMIRVGEPRNGRARGSTPTWEVLRARLPLIGLNLGTMIVGSGVALALTPERFPLAWPGLQLVVAQAGLIFLVEDAAFYLWHRLLHRHKGLYRRIHRLHHQAWAPLPIEYIYVHPIEWMGGALAPAIVIAGFALSEGGLNAWSLWIYILLRQLHELNIHATSAHAPHATLPGLGRPEDHALHHAKPTLGNYASMLRLWDRAFGTRISAR